jgi:hypothetical protein
MTAKRVGTSPNAPALRLPPNFRGVLSDLLEVPPEPKEKRKKSVVPRKAKAGRKKH